MGLRSSSLFSSVFVAFLSLYGLNARAVTLAPVIDPQDDRLPIEADAPPIECDKIIDQLVAYNQMARQHDAAVNSFLGDVANKLNGWYSLLAPLEGKTQTLAVGTFAPVKDGGDKIGAITGMAYDNTDLLSADLDKIIQSARECEITKRQPHTPAP